MSNRLLVIAAAFLAACTAGNPDAQPGLDAGADLLQLQRDAGACDLHQLPDLVVPPDLTRVPDLLQQLDLTPAPAIPDLTPALDLVPVPACFPGGHLCNSATDCCDGAGCYADGAGSSACCHYNVGDPCKTPQDCCGGLVCVGTCCRVQADGTVVC